MNIHKKDKNQELSLDWGAGVVEQVSLDLKREFPNADGFSVRNLWYMKQWYLFYTQGEEEIMHQVGAELQRIENQYLAKMHQVGAELSSEKLHQVGGEFPLFFVFSAGDIGSLI